MNQRKIYYRRIKRGVAPIKVVGIILFIIFVYAAFQFAG